VFTEAELLKVQKNGQFPDDPVRIKVGQIQLAITGINDTALGDLLLWPTRYFRILSAVSSLSD
jgi:hypothetical protein